MRSDPDGQLTPPLRRARECEDAAEEDWEAMLAEAARRNSRAGASDGTSVLHAVCGRGRGRGPCVTCSSASTVDSGRR